MKLIKIFFGSTLVIIGGYYAYKSGYHLINYDQTYGLESGTFGYGRPYWEITIEFLFWLTVVIGGIGFLWLKRIGLIIGMYSLILPTLVSITFLIAEISRKMNYSTTMMVNAEQREMTLGEQLNYIYSEPVFLAILTLLLIAIFWKTMKQLKIEKV